LSPSDARAVLSGLQASIPVKKLPADIENHNISSSTDGKDIPITIVRPPNSSDETLPVVMFFHGGGWILGGFDTHDRLVRELANNANAAIVFVNILHPPKLNILFLWNRHMLPQSGFLKMVKPFT
jgi:acetyl esterase